MAKTKEETWVKEEAPCEDHKPLAIEFVPVYMSPKNPSIELAGQAAQQMPVMLKSLVAVKVYCPNCGMVQKLDAEEIAHLE